MGRTPPGLDTGTTATSNDQELRLPLIIKPHQSPAAPAVRPVRPSIAAGAASWRERVRARSGVEELLTFHVGRERFATSLGSIEEAVERPDVYRVPEMPETMLGVFSLRGRLIPVCSPMRALGVELVALEPTVLLMRAGTRRVGVAVDDVDDVIALDLATIRPSPGTEDPDGVLLGVVRQGNELIAIVDPDAIVATCLTGQVMETT
jgi:purine-binding chemotaxis protein CheW